MPFTYPHPSLVPSWKDEAKFDIPTLTGKEATTEIEQYISKASIKFQSSKKPFQILLTDFTGKFTLNAAEWWESVLTEGRTPSNHTEFLGMIRDRFVGEYIPGTAMVEIMSLKQGPKENVETYAQNIARIARRGDHNLDSDHIIRLQFAKGLLRQSNRVATMECINTAHRGKLPLPWKDLVKFAKEKEYDLIALDEQLESHPTLHKKVAFIDGKSKPTSTPPAGVAADGIVAPLTPVPAHFTKEDIAAIREILDGKSSKGGRKRKPNKDRPHRSDKRARSDETSDSRPRNDSSSRSRGGYRNRANSNSSSGEDRSASRNPRPGKKCDFCGDTSHWRSQCDKYKAAQAKQLAMNHSQDNSGRRDSSVQQPSSARAAK
jgi:hypothetical protein